MIDVENKMFDLENNNMAHLALVIGNGFDIDAGLPSKYSDFIDSPEWQKMCEDVQGLMNFPGYKENSLIAHLQNVFGEKNWFDVEEEIYNFVKAHPFCDNSTIADIRTEFNAIKKALINYLKRVGPNVKASKDTFSWKLMHALEDCPMTKNLIYFNYTSCFNLVGPTYYLPEAAARFTNVHGSLNDNIVLGCDLHQEDKINRQLSFMYKYNMVKHSNHIVRNLMLATEIIFFGHSVNEMDFGYFRQFFEVVSKSFDPKRHLTFITYDEESERNIKDNIRNQGIDVTGLYNNLYSFTFFHTKNLYNNDQKEISKWNEFIMRVISQDYKSTSSVT